jgi:hypothetical protein
MALGVKIILSTWPHTRGTRRANPSSAGSRGNAGSGGAATEVKGPRWRRVVIPRQSKQLASDSCIMLLGYVSESDLTAYGEPLCDPVLREGFARMSPLCQSRDFFPCRHHARRPLTFYGTSIPIKRAQPQTSGVSPIAPARVALTCEVCRPAAPSGPRADARGHVAADPTSCAASSAPRVALFP